MHVTLRMHETIFCMKKLFLFHVNSKNLWLYTSLTYLKYSHDLLLAPLVII